MATRYGRFWLYLGQTCETTLSGDGRYILHTVSYRYTLTADGEHEPLFRWEYEKRPAGPYCRHHLQGPLHIPLGPYGVPLDDLHLPTGFVTIEEVLRFCIVDLGVTCRSSDWDRILSDSYELFKTEFAPRGHL